MLVIEECRQNLNLSGEMCPATAALIVEVVACDKPKGGIFQEQETELAELANGNESSGGIQPRSKKTSGMAREADNKTRSPDPMFAARPGSLEYNSEVLSSLLETSYNILTPLDTQYYPLPTTNDTALATHGGILLLSYFSLNWRAFGNAQSVIEPTVVNMAVIMAELMTFAIRITLETDLVPLPQGDIHWPKAMVARHDEPGPAKRSYPAAVASPWNRVCV
ncbi:uncharacterized protein F5891DRAFT_985911 [Suillus fuscotomentosus]|uniref:Uncharacterized protein n=1 Tax=Suillus fuscotomentosus TaxID=1912939 RepID=A0AAD4DT86_9AGAM|nr:uncharacterized protein F5891DRAFT_985911 [Suillus fuscotomentosus]KAG1893402.1 hypothetical protein F5891DRAFT_985911 [Suillus fuscotomentosus]